MKKHYLLLLLLTMLAWTACIKDRFEPLSTYTTANLENTEPFDTVYKAVFEGIYELSEGDDGFGQQFAGKWANGYLCLFGARDGRFINLEVGYKPSDSSFRMAGFWRDPIQPQQGQIQLTMIKTDGVDSVFAHKSNGIVLRGYLENDPGKTISIRYKRPFSAAVSTRPFIIAAHRGGGRNSDNLPYAENSLDLVKHVGQFGATGIEIDIRLTKDKVPIIYHDPDINTRLTRKSPLVGDIHQFNADFLRAYIKLVDGQSIPTLDEMLTTIIDATDIPNVWLDCKDGGEDGFFNYVVPVLQKARSYAQSRNRNIGMLLGLPSKEAYDNFIAFPGHQQLPSLCEIGLDEAKNAGSRVFAPRWTLGLLEAETADAHAHDIKVVTWTLDDPGGMSEVITQSRYDGILTNYPSMLAYTFYSQE
ncbi:glycerophosphodiester phosphodiesterase [Taibaiella koreensis]|uniref:glycerophosphodiester phosphodiesterase n=1 Tax=Taibaiella koreensis TaxID=1268548 RepID=UPI000E59A7A4|nr:glycerophosphodiester phosphodiesterase family protein [Taibaiella koreensis]